MGLYFMHERMWHRIGFGKKEIPSFVVWFTGLPASGKKALADRVYRRLAADKLKVERLDSQDVRPLFPATGFAPEDVHLHVSRAGHLCAMLEKNGVCVVASFVSPYQGGRQFARSLARNFIEVHMKSTVEACEKRDTKGHYEKARRGEYRYFPGVDMEYEEPLNPEITIDADHLSLEEAAEKIVTYLRRHVMIGRIPKPSLESIRVEPEKSL
jgi:adenylylsulfate kinase